MPSGQNWVNFLYINIAFAIYIAAVFYFNQISEIKANWPLYRCNPMYMILADNVEENFTYCIQNTKNSFMGYLLQPITFITTTLTVMMSGFIGDIQNISEMFNKIRTIFSSIINSIFGVFLNLIFEFKRVIVGPGEMVRSMGKCFYPFTSVKLNDGTIKYMKDIELGDVLKDGSIVESVLKIDNKKNKLQFYLIEDEDVDIFVTGSHLVFDKSKNDFVRVENYEKATKTDLTNDWFSCLITDTHRIHIGNEIFWDWEDHFVKLSV
jgi:hypothetical protein